MLIFLFSISVTGNWIFNFFGHFFISDTVAESIGWEPGSPFQLEIAFANLAIGILGLIATGRQDSFQEATVIAVTIFSVGVTIVHLMDIIATGNLAPGNTMQNVGNILRSALLIVFLVASCRAKRSPHTEAGTIEFDRWVNAARPGFSTDYNLHHHCLWAWVCAEPPLAANPARSIARYRYPAYCFNMLPMA